MCGRADVVGGVITRNNLPHGNARRILGPPRAPVQ